MASKQYISIVRLFNYCDISTGKDFNLSRTKKQLQAEFGIAQEGFIEIDGYTYTRHDVFEEFGQPDFLKRLNFHKQIWNTPVLLQLLEDNSFNVATIREGFRPFWNDMEFDEFFSPYFVGPFNYISRGLLSEERFSDIAELLQFEDFLQAPEREEAFRSIRIFLDENFRLIRNTTGENYKMMRTNIALWIDKEWYPFFNALPHEFYDIKQDMVVRLINLGVAIQKTYRRDCRSMSEQLISLQEMPESTRQTIVSNHAAYHSSKSPNLRGTFWIGWVIFIVIRAVASNGCNDTSTDYQYFQNNNFNKVEIDSLVNTLRDSSKTRVGDTIILRDAPKELLH